MVKTEYKQPPNSSNMIGIEYQKFENIVAKNNLSEKLLFDKFCKESYINIDEKANYSNELYFITIHINGGLRTARNNSIECSMGLLYKSLCAKFIKNSNTNNLHLLPFTQLYFDFEGSRDSVVAHNIEVPHFHGLMLLHPKTIERFEDFLMSSGVAKIVNGRESYQFTARQFPPLESITFTKFDPSTSLDDTISYVTKSARNNRFAKGDGDYIELSHIYPRLPKRLYPFYKHSKRPIFSEEQYASFENQN